MPLNENNILIFKISSFLIFINIDLINNKFILFVPTICRELTVKKSELIFF